MSVELLTQAVKDKETQIIELLLKKVDLNSKDNRGWSPLHWAALYGHTDIARFFIDKGAEVNAKDKNGCTPLHWAAKKGHADIVRILLNAGADDE